MKKSLANNQKKQQKTLQVLYQWRKSLESNSQQCSQYSNSNRRDLRTNTSLIEHQKFEVFRVALDRRRCLLLVFIHEVAEIDREFFAPTHFYLAPIRLEISIHVAGHLSWIARRLRLWAPIVDKPWESARPVIGQKFIKSASGVYEWFDTTIGMHDTVLYVDALTWNLVGVE